MCGAVVQAYPRRRAGGSPAAAWAAQRRAWITAAAHGAFRAATLEAWPRSRPTSPQAMWPVMSNGTGCQSGELVAGRGRP